MPPFREALESSSLRSLLPTDLSSAQLSTIAPEILERAFFSARVINTHFLQLAHDRISALARGLSPGPGQYTSVPSARADLKELLDSINYTPADPADAGTIKDLRTDNRLNLILDTNTRMARGYGQHIQGQDPDILDSWPAQELIRIHDRKEPRDWLVLWQAEGGQLYGGGRMIARKDDPIWENISAFGLPYPPFDFNSGMGLADIDRIEAETLGVLTPEDKITPKPRGFNTDLQISMPARDAQLRAALMQDIGDLAALDGDTLKWQNNDRGLPPRYSPIQPRPSDRTPYREDPDPGGSGRTGQAIRERLRSTDLRAALDDSAQRILEAEILSVASGRKPLYHDAWGSELSASISAALQPALPHGVEVRRIGDQLVVYRRRDLQNLFDSDPAFYRPGGETFQAALERVIRSGQYGELLGYAARATTEPGAVRVTISDPQGQKVKSFFSRPGLAHAIGEAQAEDIRRITGQQYQVTIKAP
jgi:hypothetical protein